MSVNDFYVNEPYVNEAYNEQLYHELIAGAYTTQMPNITRVLVVGKDEDGNYVYGEAQDDDLIDEVGERLDLRIEDLIDDADDAEDVAEAVLEKVRLDKSSGYIIVPVHSGCELFDVINVKDGDVGKSSGAKYRILAIETVFDAREGIYQQNLTLGEV